MIPYTSDCKPWLIQLRKGFKEGGLKIAGLKTVSQNSADQNIVSSLF